MTNRYAANSTSPKRERKSQVKEIENIIGMRTAVLIDGDFFLRRYRICFKKQISNPELMAKEIHNYALSHAEGKSLYRIFYYDCWPFEKKILNPISNRNIEFNKTSVALFRKALFNALMQKRKIALRLGELHDGRNWILKPLKFKELLNNRITVKDLTGDDIYYDLIQKGVDIKIGADISSLAYKRLVQQIVLISGDSDFVPAAKVARREGIDFILDPMFNHVKQSLFEHIDGIASKCPNPNKSCDD